jgi:iron complex outermembrane receptor protein
MNRLQLAAAAVLLFVPLITMGQDKPENHEQATDEIVVLGRFVTTRSTRIEVDREMLVDTAKALKYIPGANVNSNGLITGIAQYRGMYGDRVAVDIDQLGMISGGPNAMDAPLSYMSPMITEDLVVARGIADVSSAPESIGGYINTKLARGKFGGESFAASGTLGTRYSDNGDVSTSAGRLTLANARHRFSVATEQDFANDIATPVGDIRPSGLRRERYDLSYAYADQDKRLLLFAGKLDTTDSGTAALPMDIRFIRTDIYGLQFGKDITDNVAIQGRFAYNDVEHLMDNFTLRGAPAPMSYRQNLADGSGSRFALSAEIALARSELQIGIDGIMASHDSVITNPNMAMFRVDNFVDVDRDVISLFTEWEQDFESSTIKVGLRYKQVETAAGNVGAMGLPDPMGSAVNMLADAFNSSNRNQKWNSIDAVFKYRHVVSDSTEWLVELGSKTRAPSYQELYLWLPLQATGGLADGRSYIGDLALDDERSNEIVVGITTNLGRFSMSPQIFLRKVDNYIQGIPSTNDVANGVSMMMSGMPALQFSNVDAEIWGADIAWNLQLHERWFIDGVASYNRGRRTDSSDNLYRLAPLNGSIGLTYVSDNWSAKPEVVFYAAQDDVSSYNNESPSAAYELVNVALAWNPSESLRFEARVDNLLNEAYQDHLAGINRAMASGIPLGERIYGAERTLSAGVILSF